MSLAVLILTYNEEKHIADCIASAQSVADEIVLIDSGSTDATVELAKSAGARVIVHPMTDGFAAQRNFALSQTTAAWVLYLDADERVTPKLALTLEQLKKVPVNELAAYALQRRNIAFGKPVNHGVLRPDWVVRLFPRQSVSWEGKVHERPVGNWSVERLPGFLRHYTYVDWHHYFAKFNNYTTLWSEEAYARGKRTSWFSAFVHAKVAFAQMYWLKRGFLDGWLGLVLCCFHFAYTLAKYVKLLDLQRTKENR